MSFPLFGRLPQHAPFPSRPAVLCLALLAGGLTAGAQAADFGSPPSGEIPILYNDHTVYAKPDILKKSRVLAAIERDGHIYVPLRSMLEQMGATVSISNGGRTVTAAKSGSSVSVTLGRDDVVINGEARPLDVPPVLYHGVVLVPVRVLSEALGAYVLWVHDKRVVVVRYIPAEAPAPPVPPPTAAPAATPTLAPLPTAAPTAAPTEASYRGFIQGAFSAPKNYNEFSSGQYCPQSYVLSAAYAPERSKFALKLDYRQDAYVTNTNLTDTYGNQFTGFATIDGGYAFTPVFLARQSTFDVRLEYQVAAPRIYAGVGYLVASNNYGYPQLNAVGIGIEKLPDLRRGLGLFGSAFYYPSASGDYTVTSPASLNYGLTYRLQYQLLKYDLGLAYVWAHSPPYLQAGFSGDRYGAKQNAPIGQTHDGPYLGLGVKF